MARVERFEDLLAWQRARGLAKVIHDATAGGSFAKDRSLTDQIRRASVSVQNNIAEGFERGSRAEFAKALTISKGSAGEVRSMLYNALDFGYVSRVAFDELMDLTLEVSRLVAALRASVQRQRDAERTNGRARTNPGSRPL